MKEPSEGAATVYYCTVWKLVIFKAPSENRVEFAFALLPSLPQSIFFDQTFSLGEHREKGKVRSDSDPSPLTNNRTRDREIEFEIILSSTNSIKKFNII